MRKFPAQASSSADGAFFFSGYLVLKRSGERGAVEFMLDTGSAKTIIGEDDLKNLGPDVESFPRSLDPIAGWGGTAQAHEVDDVIIIMTDGEGHSEPFEMDRVICGRNPKRVREKAGIRRTMTVAIPSVIGRDFLRRHGLIVHIDVRHDETYMYV